VVGSQLTVIYRTAVPEEPRLAIARQRRSAEHFSKAAFNSPPPYVHLPQPVLGHYVPLREEYVVRRFRKDVRYAPGIAQHLDFVLQPGHAHRAVDA
jgi:hypothetical protein